MNFAGTIARLGGRQTTVTRQLGAPTIVDGRAVPAGTTTLTIMANEQPLKGEDLLRIPEGLRVSDMIKVYSSAELRGLDDEIGQLPDLLLWNGRTYEVQNVQSWQTGGFWKVLAARVPGLPAPPVLPSGFLLEDDSGRVMLEDGVSLLLMES